MGRARLLRGAHCEDAACTTATRTTLDDAGGRGQNSAITIGADGLGLISYRDFQEDAVKVAHCADVACTSVTTAVG
jgi:hypothetical protein